MAVSPRQSAVTSMARASRLAVLIGSAALAALTLGRAEVLGEEPSAGLVPEAANLFRSMVLPEDTRPVFIAAAQEGRIVLATSARDERGWVLYGRIVDLTNGFQPEHRFTIRGLGQDPASTVIALDAARGTLGIGGNSYSVMSGGETGGFCKIEGACHAVPDPLGRGFLVLGSVALKRVVLPFLSVLNHPVSFVGKRDYGIWLSGEEVESDGAHAGHRKATLILSLAGLSPDALIATAPGRPRIFLVQAGSVWPISLEPLIEGIRVRSDDRKPAGSSLSQDGRLLALGIESEVVLWDAARVTRIGGIASKVIGGPVRALAFVGPGSSTLAVLTEHRLLLVDTESRQAVSEFHSDVSLRGLTAGPIGDCIATFDTAGNVLVFRRDGR